MSISLYHLVLTGLVQYVQSLHGHRHSFAVVMELGDQQLHAPATEELHAGTQQHTQVLGGVQSAYLHRGEEQLSQLFSLTTFKEDSANEISVVKRENRHTPQQTEEKNERSLSTPK